MNQVKPGSLMAVKIAICQHLPILVYNHSSSSASSSDSPSKSNWDCGQGVLRSSLEPVQGIRSRISSIYLDNHLSLQTYRRRLDKEDGAALLRVRWYGEGSHHRGSPKICSVFLERKVTTCAIAPSCNSIRLGECLKLLHLNCLHGTALWGIDV